MMASHRRKHQYSIKLSMMQQTTSKRQGAHMAKTDIAEAFRIVPVEPSQYHLMGIHWRGEFFYDRCLAMGLRSSCNIFEQLSTAVHWTAVQHLDIAHMVHLIDDFLHTRRGKINLTVSASSAMKLAFHCHQRKLLHQAPP